MSSCTTRTKDDHGLSALSWLKVPPQMMPLINSFCHIVRFHTRCGAGTVHGSQGSWLCSTAGRRQAAARLQTAQSNSGDQRLHHHTRPGTPAQQLREAPHEHSSSSTPGAWHLCQQMLSNGKHLLTSAQQTHSTSGPCTAPTLCLVSDHLSRTHPQDTCSSLVCVPVVLYMIPCSHREMDTTPPCCVSKELYAALLCQHMPCCHGVSSLGCAETRWQHTTILSPAPPLPQLLFSAYAYCAA